MLKPPTVFPLAIVVSIICFEAIWPVRTRSSTGTFLGYSLSFILSAFFWFWYQVYFYPFYFSPLRGLPTGDQKWTELGFIDANPLRRDKWAQTIPNDGFIRHFGPLNTERILVLSEEAFRAVVTNTEQVRRSLTAGLELTLGRTNLVSLFGPQHKISRKRVQPAFNAPYIRELYPIFWSKAVELASELAKEGPAPINISDWIDRLTLDVICLSGFGADCDSIHKPDGPLPRAYDLLAHPKGLGRLRFAQAILPEWRWLRFRASPTLFNASRHLRANSEALVQRRLEDIRSGRAEKSNNRDILDLALRDGTASMEELIDYTMTFLGAGHETTSAALAWCIFEISRLPNVQDRIRSDIQTHLPSPTTGQPITAAHIDKLPTLASFISEVLRFHPPIPSFFREAMSDVVLADQFIPKGTKLVMGVRQVNALPDRWTSSTSPAAFDPWRFLDDGSEPKLTNGGATSLYSMMSFSRGEKNCIGERFARAQLAVELAVLIGRFNITFAGAGKPGVMKLEDATRPFLLSDKIDGGVWVHLTELEGW